MAQLLVTGGAGYIGSHLVLDLLLAGHDVVVVDDLSTGHHLALTRVAELAGRGCRFVHADIADVATVASALDGVDAVFHLAAFKLVTESMVAPERYFRNNVAGTAALLEAMVRAGVTRLVYSSSAAVYGPQPDAPISEDAQLNPESPYGVSKAQGETMLSWMCARRGWAATSLRYFNPVGTHHSGRIGQPQRDAAALAPRVLNALQHADQPLTVYGTDWPTPDGTCLRDYIHIADLNRAHLLALQVLLPGQHGIFNVGSGRPHSVREVLASCRRVTGREVPTTDGPRRDGDMARSTADASRFHAATGFIATGTLDDMLASAWTWAAHNPAGYAT